MMLPLAAAVAVAGMKILQSFYFPFVLSNPPYHFSATALKPSPAASLDYMYGNLVIFGFAFIDTRNMFLVVSASRRQTRAIYRVITVSLMPSFF